MMTPWSIGSSNSNGSNGSPLMKKSKNNSALYDAKDASSPAEQALHIIGEMLHHADHAITDLEANDMLGSAIIRKCQELADMIHDLAADATNITPNQTTQLATISEDEMKLDDTKHNNHDDINVALVLLRDVESTLRSIDQSEAEEIADVAVTLARLVLTQMELTYSTLTPQDLMLTTNNAATARDLDFSSRIEFLEEEEEDDDYDEEKKDDYLPRTATSNTRSTSPSSVVRTLPPPPPPSSLKRDIRVRALWPPLGPSVCNACHWTKEQALQRPVLAAALSITLWPAALMTAACATPLLVADSVAQHVYNSVQDTPVVHTVERSVAQVHQAGRLYLLCSKLVAKQGIRVVKRHVERQGGLDACVNQMGGWCVDRVTNPMETVGMGWSGLCAGLDVVQNVVSAVQGAVSQEMEKPNADLTSL